MKKISNEIMTGLMVLMCVLILIFLTVKTKGAAAFKKGQALQVQFDYAAGLKKGSPVYLTGVEIGEVKDVAINYTAEGTKVMFQVEMDKAAKVREDSKAYIATMGLMGEKYLELTSGSKDAKFLNSGSLIVGKEPLRMEEIADKVMGIADNLNSGISDLRKLTTDADSVLTGNKAQISNIIENMNETSLNFVAFSDDIKRYPWKLLMKTKETPKEEPRKGKEHKEEGNKGLL